MERPLRTYLAPLSCVHARHCSRSRRNQHSYVIPSEVEGPHKCGTRHPSRGGPSTALRMTSFLCLVPALTVAAVYLSRRLLAKTFGVAREGG
jgi:hypothetical protein